MMNRRNLAAGALCLSFGVGASAQNPFPSRPVRIVVPSSAGSGPDQIARIVGQALSEKWNQPVVIENRAGASGVLGFDMVAKAEPDGHTLLVAAHNLAIVPALSKTPFDLNRDFAPIGRLATAGMVLVAHPSMNVRSLKEYVAVVKKAPGKFSYGSAGPGTTHHMMMELLKYVAQLHMVHIPYRGPGPIIPDLLEGRLSSAFLTTPAALIHVPTGKLRAIAVAGDKRLPQFADVPTIAEAGYKAFDPVLWYGMFAPSRVPAAIVEQLDRDVASILATPKVIEGLRSAGIDASAMNASKFRAFVAADFAQYQKLVRDTGITAE